MDERMRPIRRRWTDRTDSWPSAGGNLGRDVAAGRDVGRKREIDLIEAGEVGRAARIERGHNGTGNVDDDVGADLHGARRRIIGSTDGAESGAVEH